MTIMSVTPRTILMEMLIFMVFVRELEESDAVWVLISEVKAEAAPPLAAVGVAGSKLIELTPVELV